MKKYFPVCFACFLVILFTSSCEKDPIGNHADHLSFPVGRSFLSASSVDISIAGQAYEADFAFDSCGGYWLHIPKSALSSGDQIKIRFTRKREELQLFSQLSGYKQDWLRPSPTIDSDHEELKRIAQEITEGYDTNIEKAKRIQVYVVGHVYLKIYFDASLDKASTTNQLGYGTCMNSSKLFVALCRAVNIPARSVWGVVHAHDGLGGYNNHHQWAEMLDENGYWHPMDFGYTTHFDLNDIRYLDLLYAAEENTIIRNRGDYHIMFEDLLYHNDHPTPPNGKLKFRLLEDSRPDSMVVEYSYDYLAE